MAKKEGRIVTTGVNSQGVPWKEISFIEDKPEKPKENKSRNKKIEEN